MTDFFDRKGKPLELLEWAELYENREYRQVALTSIDGWTVSTIWQGFSDQLDGHNQFETARWETLYNPQDSSFTVVDRYFTEEDALAGHAEIVAQLTGAGF